VRRRQGAAAGRVVVVRARKCVQAAGPGYSWDASSAPCPIPRTAGSRALARAAAHAWGGHSWSLAA
jgi:hypothetical protein